ncbi:MAG: sigma-70 family RNA polymerase sigma factor [Lentisphaerae bacterium]|nr:sigma-70 family RNA polymerase sigma factor [Lentisphaerota bacterium]
MGSLTLASGAAATFPQTRWSVVVTAKRRSAAGRSNALETLYRAYWYPLYAYARRCGQAPHDAQDLTQGFFCRLIEKEWLDGADRDKGRLRTFLVVAMRNFMRNEWRRASAGRRGGGQINLSIDGDLAESRYAAEPPARLTADDEFDRQWALAVLELTLRRLQEESAAAGKAGDFEALKECLMAARGGIDYAGVAARLGMQEGAARVAVHRLRKRFRAIYREEIAQTLNDGADVDDELRHLAAALARG